MGNREEKMEERYKKETKIMGRLQGKWKKEYQLRNRHREESEISKENTNLTAEKYSVTLGLSN